MASPRTKQDTSLAARTPSLSVITVIMLALVALVGAGLLLTRPHSPHEGTAGPCGSASTAGAAASPTTGYVIGRSGDYTTIYGNLGALKHAADIAIVGVVTCQVSTGYDDGPGAFGYTDWAVSIISVAYDKLSALTSFKTITIRQLGGTVDGQRYVDDDDPLMKVGDRALFFLRLDASGATGKVVSPTRYRGINNGEGRFPSVNGRITRNAWGNIILAKPTTEAAVVSQVQALSA